MTSRQGDAQQFQMLRSGSLPPSFPPSIIPLSLPPSLPPSSPPHLPPSLTRRQADRQHVVILRNAGGCF